MTKLERIKGESILKDWANSKQRILDIQRDINSLKDGVLPFISNPDFNSDDIVSSYNSLLSDLLDDLRHKLITYKFVDDIINQLDKFERNVIISRYQKRYSWEKISLENHISRTNCFNIKNKIIKQILSFL